MRFRFLIYKIIRCVRINFIFDFFFNPRIVRKCASQIYIIGDSHVSVFSGKGRENDDYMVPVWPNKFISIIPVFIPIRLGPVTAYNSYKKLGLIMRILNNKSTRFQKSTDYILLSFGEIDIRVHLIKQRQQKSLSDIEIINKCLNNYFKTINKLKSMGYKLMIYGPIASAPGDIIVEGFSSIGTCVERNHCTKIFSDELERRCNILKLPFISIFDKMINAEGLTDKKYLMDEVHLSSKYIYLIIERLQEVLNVSDLNCYMKIK